MRDFLGRDAYEQRLPFLERVKAGEQVSFEAEVPHLDQGTRMAAIRYVPKFGDAGFEGFHTLVFDLSREQHRFHSVFDGTAVGFWEIDLSAMREMLAQITRNPSELARRILTDISIVRRTLDATTVRAMNLKASGMFRVDRNAAIGRGLGEWVPDAHLGAWRDNLLAYLAGAESYEAETTMRREDGTSIDVLLSCAFPKQPDDQVVVIVGLVDISERVAKEQELAKAQADLAHAARVATLGELMASIAHEVNQPLAAIVANGNAALRWLRRTEPDVAEAQAAIDRMVGEGRRASEIIARTRRMALKGGEEWASFDVAGMIDEAVDITRRQVTSLGSSIQAETDPGLPQIYGDRVQLQQVVINLIVNAAQAMAAFSAGARHVSITCTRNDSELLIEVHDTGPGIDPDAVTRIFDAFYTTKSEGMGMGLSIAQTIIRSHDGTLQVHSDVTSGTVFRIALPVVRT